MCLSVFFYIKKASNAASIFLSKMLHAFLILRVSRETNLLKESLLISIVLGKRS